jgi:antitoxin component YwqK of YwqJK toxin-antitoxin module
MKKIVFILFPLIILSCQGKLKSSASESKEKEIPLTYKLINDPFFSTKQDTILYNKTKFSGYVYQVGEKQDTLLISSYYNGLKEGFSRKWYPSGQLAEQRYYIKDKKEKTHRAWWENGQILYQFTISNDQYEGEYKEWNSRGQLIQFFNYKNGQESGTQKLWYDDGKVRANYVITNGRRYGLLGTKNCKNVSNKKLNQ